MAEPPRPSPKLEIVEPPKTPTGEFRIVIDDVKKMKKSGRYKTYGLLGTLVTALLGGAGGKVALAKGESVETKIGRHDERIKTVEASVENLSRRIDAGETARQKSDLKLERLETLIELELDQHGVPKSKRPPKVAE